jgi:hypothetical protein
MQLTMSTLLAAYYPTLVSMGDQIEPLFILVKEDVRRVLEILEQVSTAQEMQKTRTDVLRSAYESIGW